MAAKSGRRFSFAIVVHNSPRWRRGLDCRARSLFDERPAIDLVERARDLPRLLIKAPYRERANAIATAAAAAAATAAAAAAATAAAAVCVVVVVVAADCCDKQADR